ncbi:uncharacterized protein O3C94_020128 [Discoglossus pictus]
MVTGLLGGLLGGEGSSPLDMVTGLLGGDMLSMLGPLALSLPSIKLIPLDGFTFLIHVEALVGMEGEDGPLGDLVAISIRVDIEITVGIELDLASPKLVFDKCENIVTGIYMKGFGVLDMAEGMLHSMAPPVLCLPVETALCLLDAAVSLFGGLLPLDMLGGLLPGGEAAAEEGYDLLNPDYDIMQIVGSDFNPDDIMGDLEGLLGDIGYEGAFGDIDGFAGETIDGLWPDFETGDYMNDVMNIIDSIPETSEFVIGEILEAVDVDIVSDTMQIGEDYLEYVSSSEALVSEIIEEGDLTTLLGDNIDIESEINDIAGTLQGDYVDVSSEWLYSKEQNGLVEESIQDNVFGSDSSFGTLDYEGGFGEVLTSETELSDYFSEEDITIDSGAGIINYGETDLSGFEISSDTVLINEGSFGEGISGESSGFSEGSLEWGTVSDTAYGETDSAGIEISTDTVQIGEVSLVEGVISEEWSDIVSGNGIIGSGETDIEELWISTDTVQINEVSSVEDVISGERSDIISGVGIIGSSETDIEDTVQVGEISSVEGVIIGEWSGITSDVETIDYGGTDFSGSWGEGFDGIEYGGTDLSGSWGEGFDGIEYGGTDFGGSWTEGYDGSISSNVGEVGESIRTYNVEEGDYVEDSYEQLIETFGYDVVGGLGESTWEGDMIYSEGEFCNRCRNSAERGGQHGKYYRW